MFWGFIHTRKKHVRFHELGYTFSSYLHEFIYLLIHSFIHIFDTYCMPTGAKDGSRDKDTGFGEKSA